MTGTLTYTLDPFPGLRPFEPEHSALFFGREEQTDELLRRLERARFLAVVGDSGSGKSSLVRAGLIPALQRGYMAEAGSRWEIALFRPGDDPVGNLARGLYRSGKDGDGRPDALQLQKILERNSMGLVQAATVILPPKTNLLVVVDQFEEIFRYKRETQKRDGGDSASAFVKLLLNASQEETSVVNVVLTMRSDFLGECSQFRGLPEALNGGQYLVPRLSREQMKEVIEGPAAVAGAEFAPMLVQRLLNDVGDNPDQLPVLQHALMRTWEESATSRADGEPIAISHYEAIGGISQALNRHVESVYRELSPEDREAAKKIFQRLTERIKGGREIRRPTKVTELRAVAGEEGERVGAVINKFREAGRTFLTSPDANLTADSVIDITHESLIRLWDTLHEWVAEEADSAHLYQRLAESAVEGRAAYHEKDLKQALAWREATRPNEAWAKRYHPAFREAMEFLDWSWKLDRARNRKKIAAIVALCVSTVVAMGFAVRTLLQDRELAARQLLAEAQRLQVLPSSLEQSALMAMESLRRAPLFGSQLVLREDIALLPRPVATLQNDTKVEALAFSPDGKLVAAGRDDGAVRLFSVADGKEVARIPGETPVLALVFSANGSSLAVANFKGAALFTPATGRQRTKLNDGTPVYSIAFSPDGLRVATGSGDGMARVCDTATGKEIWSSDQGGIVNAIAFSPNGDVVATASNDGNTRILVATTGKEAAVFQHSGQVQAVAFSPDGTLLATGGAATQNPEGTGVARIFELKNKKETAYILHHGIVNAVAFSPDGTKVVAGSQDGIARVFSAHNDNEFSHLDLDHGDAVESVAYSPDGRWVGTASWDHTGRLFEATTGREIARLIHHDKVRAVAFSPDGRLVATGSNDHTVRVFVAGGGNVISRIQHNSRVRLAVSSRDGKLVATASENANVRIVERESGKIIAMLRSPAVINVAEFSPDSRLLAVGAEDGRTVVFDAATGRAVSRAEAVFAVVSVAFSPDSSHVACGHADGSLQVFEAQAGKEILHLTMGSNTVMPSDAIRAIEFSPDGFRIIAGNDSAARVFDLATGREVAHQQLQGGVHAVAFSSRGNLVISADSEGTAALMEVPSGKEVQQIKGLGRINTVIFSHDGNLFAIGSSIPRVDGAESGMTRVFDAASGKELASLPQSKPVLRIIFSPDDRWVAAASESQIIEVFQAVDGRKIAQITADQIRDVQFAGDNSALHILSTEATATGQPTVVLVENHLLRTEDLIRQGCSRLTRNLTAEEWKSLLDEQPYRKTCPELP